MTQSTAIMGDLSETMREDMADAAIEMSQHTMFSATQLAESYFFLASAGLDAQQSIAALPSVAKFAQAGMFDLATATDLATDAQSALGLVSESTTENIKGLENVTNVLVEANTAANATVEQFSQAITNKLGGRLRLLNKDIEEGAAALAVFADQGLKGRRAGRTLTIVLRDLARLAVENADAFERNNIEVFDSQGNMRNLADIVKDFENRLRGASTAQQTAIFEQLNLNRRVQDGISLLIGFSNKLENLEEQFRETGDTVGEVSDKQLKNLIDQLGLLSDKVKAVSTQFGEAPATPLSKFVGFINSAFDAVNRHLAEQNFRDQIARELDISPTVAEFTLQVHEIETLLEEAVPEALEKAREEGRPFFTEYIRGFQNTEEAVRHLARALEGEITPERLGELFRLPSGPVDLPQGPEISPERRERLRLQEQRRQAALDLQRFRRNLISEQQATTAEGIRQHIALLRERARAHEVGSDEWIDDQKEIIRWELKLNEVLRSNTGPVLESMANLRKGMVQAMMDQIMTGAELIMSLQQEKFALEEGQIAVRRWKIQHMQIPEATKEAALALLDEIEALEKQKDALSETEKMYERIQNRIDMLTFATTEAQFDLLVQAARDAAVGVLDSMEDMITGSESWADAMLQAIQRVVRGIAEAMLQAQLLKLGMSLFGPSGGLDNLAGSPQGSMYVQPKLNLEKVTGLAKGGPVNAGEVFIVGEEGPEFFIPNRDGQVAPMAKGGKTEIKNEINMNVAAMDAASFEQMLQTRGRRAIMSVMRDATRSSDNFRKGLISGR